jgi:hypothetical protein
MARSSKGRFKNMLRGEKLVACGAKVENEDLHRSLRCLTPESPASKGRRLKRIQGLDPEDSGQHDVRQRRHGVAQHFVPNRFHKLLETYIAEHKASHSRRLAKSSNPLNLGEVRWEEEEIYQMAPWNGKLSGEEGLRELEERNGRRQAADPGPRRYPTATLEEAAASWEKGGWGMNEGNWLVALTPTLCYPGETARAGVSGAGNPESPATRHQSLRGANPRVSDLPRPDHTVVKLSMFLRKKEQVSDEGDRLGSETGH